MSVRVRVREGARERERQSAGRAGAAARPGGEGRFDVRLADSNGLYEEAAAGERRRRAPPAHRLFAS